jgi:YegS/Rv2252/BmrU family lipid kinase
VKEVSLKMSKKKIQVVFNPASAGGKTEEKKEQILTELWRQLGESFTFTETQSKTDATKITRAAISNGCNTIVAVGGDGTINEVVNGFFENGYMPDPKKTLGIINCGTGRGFAQSLGLPHAIKDQIEVIKNGNTKSLDIGRICFRNNNHKQYFINEFQIGIGGAVANGTSSNTKRVLGKYTFGAEVLKSLFTFHGGKFRISINGNEITEDVLGLVISNGRYTGGGMKLTPNARLDDGLFDVLMIKEMSTFNRLRVFPSIYTAKHLKSNEFRLFRTNNIVFRCNNTLPAEADGEEVQETFSKAEVLPSVIKVLTNNNGDQK